MSIKKFFRRERNRIKDPILKLMLSIDKLNLEDLEIIANYCQAINAFKCRLERKEIINDE